MIRLKYNLFEIIRYTFTFHDFKTELRGGRKLEGSLIIFCFQKGEAYWKGGLKREREREGGGAGLIEKLR